MERSRYFMRLSLPLSCPSKASIHPTRPPTEADTEALGRLIYDAYHGTIDDEGESPEEAIGVAAQLFRGDFGDMLWEDSELVWDGPTCIAATLITYHRDTPFVAFSLTDPSFQRRGLARAGLERAIAHLSQKPYPCLRLLVTQGNPAETLYQSLGFLREIT